MKTICFTRYEDKGFTATETGTEALAWKVLHHLIPQAVVELQRNCL
jgi:hypothetical protein